MTRTKKEMKCETTKKKTSEAHEREKNWPLTVFERRRAGWEMLWEGSQKAFEIDWRGSTPLTTRANMCVCICATYSFSLFFSLFLSHSLVLSLRQFRFFLSSQRAKRPLVYVLRIIISFSLSLPLSRSASICHWWRNSSFLIGRRIGGKNVVDTRTRRTKERKFSALCSAYQRL